MTLIHNNEDSPNDLQRKKETKMTRQRITPVAVLLAAVLAMGATNVANGAETVRLALPLPDYQGIGGAEFAVVTGVVHGTTTGSYSWSVAAGFGGEHPVVKASPCCRAATNDIFDHAPLARSSPRTPWPS